MRCPRCNQDGFSPYGTCNGCQFKGVSGKVEELGHVAYLLGEVETWHVVASAGRDWVRERYLGRREALEIDLGLRPPPLTAAEARALQWDLFCLQQLTKKARYWQDRRWLRPTVIRQLDEEIQEQVQGLRERLQNAPQPAPTFDGVRDRLKLYGYLEGMADRLNARGRFVSDTTHAAAVAGLRSGRRKLEIEAGLRPPDPVPAPRSAPAPAPEPSKKEIEPPARPPRKPITWERVWQTLLSERTLNVLLFLGAFLMVTSATVYVVFNWGSLPAFAQLGFILLFTLSFYAAGWFLRVRMKLRASGIAVTAVGSMLVPLDAYAILIASGTLPADTWPWVWLAASAVCLPLYALTGLRLRAPFFGYLVAAAAGSLVCAALQALGILKPWWLVALAGLALALVLVADRLKEAKGAQALLANPLRISALFAPAILLPLGTGWWIVEGAKGVDFGTSLAGAWALVTVLYLFAAASDKSPWLGRAAATVLPGALFFGQNLVFHLAGIEWPWHSPGWAILGTVYLVAGHRFLARATDQGEEGERRALFQAHGRTAAGWGLALMAIAGVWCFADLWAAAVTYALLAGGVALAVRLWDQPRALPAASFLAFVAVTFGLTAADLDPAWCGLGWALLAWLHVAAALLLRAAPEYAARLFGGAVACAAAAVLPPLVLSDRPLLTGILGAWMGLAALLAWLDHRGRDPGLGRLLRLLGPLRQSALAWAMALPLPLLAVLIYDRFGPLDAWVSLLLTLLAWACFGAGQARRLSSASFNQRHWSMAWYTTGYGCSLAAPLFALHFGDQSLLATSLLLAAALYFFSAWILRLRGWLVPGGLALPLGISILLDFWGATASQQAVALASLAAIYLLGGTGLERRRGTTRAFLAPLYAVAHLVALVAVVWGMEPAVKRLLTAGTWPRAACLWAVGGQLILAAAYVLFAWFRAQERWAHIAAWLGVMAAGLAISAFEQGQGWSALAVALLAAVYVLAERALAAGVLRFRRPPAGAAIEAAWPLFRRPLLVAGWAMSAGAVLLALGHNLVLLGGGRESSAWAIAALLAVTTLYALAAWIFRRRLFLWLAGGLAIAPWTLLAAWGWFLWAAPPPLPRYALSWAVLACIELGTGLVLTASWKALVERGTEGQDYGFPLRVVANLLLPVALVWGAVDPATSSLIWGLGLAFYLVSAVADHRRGLAGWRGARFLYPSVVAVLVWPVYLLHHLVPTAPYEVYGLLMLGLSLPLLAGGRVLQRFDRARSLPLYLGAYGAAIAGTALVAPLWPLLAVALTFDALLCLLSAWIFRQPLWGYPAAALMSGALLVALAESQVPVGRYGWFLIALGAVYLALAWLLRRLKRAEYATPALVATFALVALGLPPSSLDEAGAFWGYLGAALVCGLAGVWLRQPPILWATAALLAVPYGVGLVWLGIEPASYGLALFPGVAAALAVAHLLDRWTGAPDPGTWRLAALRDWWAAPWYAWGYVGALVAVGLSWADPVRLAGALVLAAVTFGHATWRFRSRGSLLLAGALAQGAVLAAIDAGGWLADPAWAALAFLPVTAITAALALAIERWQGEGSPLGSEWLHGWSRPLYLLLVADLVAGQAAALFHSQPGAVVTVAHALLLALLATVWVQPALPYAAAGLGIVGLFQGMAWAGVELTLYPVGLALLALGYGLLGYGGAYLLRGHKRMQIWSRPLERMALGLSAGALLLVGVAAGGVVVLGDLPLDDYVAVLAQVLALAGLLYLATALVRRWTVLGYGAVAMLMAAWALWWRFSMGMANVQWYAIPAGLYLLGVGWMECRQGRRTLACWIDRAGMLIWLGTAWWQSLPGVMETGWPYALIMGAESLFLVWWGSARRQKRFLYVGASALVVNVMTQLVEPLLSANLWIVLGIAGALIGGLAILVERKLEAIREFSVDLRVQLEAWE